MNTNEERAERGRGAVASVHSEIEFEMLDTTTAASDCLADIFHWIALNDGDIESAIGYAWGHYNEEVRRG
jgi:hypothetical protein